MAGILTHRHWLILDDDIQRTILQQQFDMVTCVSALEHIQAYDQAVRTTMGLLKPGGHLVITGHYTDAFHVNDCCRVPGADAELAAEPYIGNSYSGEDLRRWLRDGEELIGGILEGVYWKALGSRYAHSATGAVEPRSGP